MWLRRYGSLVGRACMCPEDMEFVSFLALTIQTLTVLSKIGVGSTHCKNPKIVTHFVDAQNAMTILNRVALPNINTRV